MLSIAGYRTAARWHQTGVSEGARSVFQKKLDEIIRAHSLKETALSPQPVPSIASMIRESSILDRQLFDATVRTSIELNLVNDPAVALAILDSSLQHSGESIDEYAFFASIWHHSRSLFTSGPDHMQYQPF